MHIAQAQQPAQGNLPIIERQGPPQAEDHAALPHPPTLSNPQQQSDTALGHSLNSHSHSNTHRQPRCIHWANTEHDSDMTQYSADTLAQSADEEAEGNAVLAHSGNTLLQSSEYLVNERQPAWTALDQPFYTSTSGSDPQLLPSPSDSAPQHPEVHQNILCMPGPHHPAQPLPAAHPPACQHNHLNNTSWHLCSSQLAAPSYQQVALQALPQLGTHAVQHKQPFTSGFAGSADVFATHTLQQPQGDARDNDLLAVHSTHCQQRHSNIQSKDQHMARQHWSDTTRADATGIDALKTFVQPDSQLHPAATCTAASRITSGRPLRALQDPSCGSQAITAAASALAAEAAPAADASVDIIHPQINSQPSTSRACCNGQEVISISKRSSPEPAETTPGPHVWKRKKRAPQVVLSRGCLFSIPCLLLHCHMVAKTFLLVSES